MRLRALCGTLCLLSITATAFADGTESAQNEAKARFKEGKALYAQGKIDDARLKFLQACAVLQDDTCMRNLSVAEYYSGHYVEAYRDIKSLLARGVLKAEPQVQREFEEMARQAYDKTGHIQVKGVDGSVVVIDEREKAGTCPISDPVDVVVGSHVVVARKDDQIERREVDVAAGKITQVDLTPAVVTPPPGGGDVKPPPGGGDVKPPPGGETETKHMFPPPTGSIVLAGVGLVGIGLGFGFFADASSKYSDINPGPGGLRCDLTPASAACAAGEDKRSSAATSQTISTISFVAGGVALAGAVAWWLVAPRTEKKVTVIPIAGPQGAGFSVLGTF